MTKIAPARRDRKARPGSDLAGPADATVLTGPGDEQVHGGRELVFIGTGLRTDGLRTAFARCLLDDAEHAAGPHVWTAFEDPFPAWDEYALQQEHDHSHA